MSGAHDADYRPSMDSDMWDFAGGPWRTLSTHTYRPWPDCEELFFREASTQPVDVLHVFQKSTPHFDPNPERTRPSTEGDKNANVLGGRFLQLACIVSNERMEEQAEGSALPSR